MPETPELAMRAFRFCLDPTEDQRVLMAKHAGANRVAFNHAMAIKQEAFKLRSEMANKLIEQGEDTKAAWKQAPKIPNYIDIQKIWNAERGDETTGTEGIFPWHKEVSSYAFSSARANADVAFKNWMDSRTGKRKGRAMGFPKFKKKGKSKDSYSIYHDVKKPSIKPDGYRRIVVPKHGSIRIQQSTKAMVKLLNQGGHISSVTISRGANRWYASMLVRYTPTPAITTKAQKEHGRVGVDLGVNALASLSDGTQIANPRHLKEASKKLAKAQRALSRTEKGSNRRKKAARKVARIHHLVSEQRAANLHQITKKLTTGWAEVAIEDLNVAGMTRSAKGTMEKPGKNVKQKSGLNRSVLDASFGEFRRQLDYKKTWYGSQLAVCDQWFPSSKTCSSCGAVKAKLHLSERVYQCPCGLTLDRDVNAAINIAAAAVLPGDSSTVASDRGETLNARGDLVRLGLPSRDHRNEKALEVTLEE